MEFLTGLLIVLMITLIIINGNLKSKYKKTLHQLSEKSLENQKLEKQFRDYMDETEHLKKYQGIVDAEEEQKRIIQKSLEIKEQANKDSNAKIYDATKKAEKITESARVNSIRKLDQANLDAKYIRQEAKDKANLLKEKAEQKLLEANDLANKLEENARLKAETIAGEAWEAKKNADQYSQTVKAMKNIIKGYGDEYLIPNEGLLDNLAEEYTHEEAGRDLAKVRSLIKLSIKNREAANCDYVENVRRETAIEFVLDAFNGKVDSIMSKVKHDNYGKLLQSIKDSFRIVNHNGRPFRNARITEKYFDLILEQLKLAVTVSEIKLKDREEQKRIREEIREEARAKREYEKAIKEAEKEERLLAKAFKEAEKKLAKATEEQRTKYELELKEIKEKLALAEEKGQRAMSMAQQTKRGHVYIISNVGSFGDDVLKIGLTRRLDPMDRVKELGDASVPFQFDVHAMIHSENAPELEKQLHKVFHSTRVNKINYRKEFFRVPLSKVKEEIDELDLKIKWTMKAEALQYRETLQLEKQEAKIEIQEVIN